MRIPAALVTLLVTFAGVANAGPASGTVKSATGTISPKFATAYVVRDSRHPRQTTVELLLTEVVVDPASLKDDLDRHMTAINLDPLRDRNYLLLWVDPDGTVRMNATYSKTMTQYINDTAGGLKGEFTTNTPAKIDGRIYSPSPLKTMDGPTYTIDVKFTADVIPAPTGTALPAGGGDPGKAFTAFLAAITKKDWTGIKGGLSPKTLPGFDRSYNTPAENLSSAVDILNARIPMAKAKVTGGVQVSPTVAVLDLEGERFGTPWLSLVKMVKTGAVWQFEESAPVGMIR
jgi:hypothetical protein